MAVRRGSPDRGSVDDAINAFWDSLHSARSFEDRLRFRLGVDDPVAAAYEKAGVALYHLAHLVGQAETAETAKLRGEFMNDLRDARKTLIAEASRIVGSRLPA